MNSYLHIYVAIEKISAQYALLSILEKWKKSLDNKIYTGAV